MDGPEELGGKNLGIRPMEMGVKRENFSGDWH
jgi:hypothetical protein